MRAGAGDSLMTFLGSCLLTALLFAGRFVLDQRADQAGLNRRDGSGRTSTTIAESPSPIPELRPVDDSQLKSPWDDFAEEDSSFVPVSRTTELPEEELRREPSTSNDPDTYKVVAVIDGDTADILVNQKPERLRFNGIDAPEKGQPFGSNAKEALSRAIAGRFVRVVVTDTDRYGRRIADLYVDGVYVNQWLVQQGLAWHYTAYSNDKKLAAAEEAARNAGRGLWSDPRHVPPWNWRRLSKIERDAYR